MNPPRDRVAFLGLGVLGQPMAGRVLETGHELIVWNRTPARAAQLQPRAQQAASAADAIADADVTILVLRDGPVTMQVLRDAAAVRIENTSALSGATFIQMGTISPDESRAISAFVTTRGARYLEAPVLGSVPQAKAGALQILVGSEPALFERWRGLLSRLGHPRLVGPVGSGATLKLALNQLIPAMHTAFALSLGIVRRSGASVEAFMEVLRQSTFYAKTFDQKLPMMQSRDFSATNFPAELMLKDVDLILVEARRLGLDPTALEGVRAVVQKTVERGAGRSDYSATYATVDPGE
jgi:3-hydroxyisobutyrate dehydrogenase